MINRTILQGRLTADPEVRYTHSDIAFAEMTVAWSEKYKEVETKCFLRCKAWRHTAEFIGKYFKKGQEIAIEGQMITESWTDGDGNNKSRNICVIDKAHFCGPASSNTGGQQKQPAARDDGFVNMPDNVQEELPFT